MKETKQASASPEARAAMHEMMAAFEAFKGANDARLEEIERKASADTLLEEKVARIDQAIAGAQARLDRVLSEARRPELGGVEGPSGASRSASAFHGEEKAAWDGYLRAGQSHGLELKAGLSTASNSAGYVVPAETERAIERRLMAGSPMREIATVKTVANGLYRKPVSTAGARGLRLRFGERDGAAGNERRGRGSVGCGGRAAGHSEAGGRRPGRHGGRRRSLAGRKSGPR